MSMFTRLLNAFCVSLVSTSLLFAQEPVNRNALERPSSCEYIHMIMDAAAFEMQSSDRIGEVMILVSRRGNKESDLKLDYKRLSEIRNYLIARGVSATQIVSAKGELTKGYGRVEIYIAGKMYGVLLTPARQGIVCQMR